MGFESQALEATQGGRTTHQATAPAYNAPMGNKRTSAAGRGSAIRPPSRFDKTTRVLALDVLESDDADELTVRSNPATEFIPDRGTKSVITENDSPDVGFRFSLNPYRGCEHGCPGHACRMNELGRELRRTRTQGRR